MGGLLKETLKSLCGVNQWSYAIYWKIGCQNTKLLIWEECYYEPAPSWAPPCIAGLQNPKSSFGEQEGCWNSDTSSQFGSRTWDDKTHLLIKKMMTKNRFNIVGQGLVGRAAFTGNHQWILADNYITDAQPPEVLNEVHLQFSAGMQTVAIITVHPHGVLQFGSSTTLEFLGLQIPRLLFLMAATNKAIHLSSMVIGQSSSLIKHIQEIPQATPHDDYLWLNPQVSFCNSRSRFNCQPMIDQPITSHSGIKSMEQHVSSGVLQNNVIDSVTVSNSQMKPESIQGFVPKLQNLEVVTSSCTRLAGNMFQQVGLPTRGHDCEKFDCIPKKESTDNDLFKALSTLFPHADNGMPFPEQLPSAFHDIRKHESGSSSTRSLNVNYGGACVQSPSGDDLFDVLGADLKSKLLGGKWNNVLAKGQDLNMQNVGKDTLIFRDMQNVGKVSSVHSAAKQISDDNMSCRTTLTKFSNASVPSSSTTFGRVNISNQVRGELLGGLPKSLLKGETLPSISYQSGRSKDNDGTCSQISQITSMNNETAKPDCKRLKPGENPRPRPKDRQMIQDRVEELREIVPNGAKCSIDALLEKTIKHMLFLQSVTKHADKLKQTGESKILFQLVVVTLLSRMSEKKCSYMHTIFSDVYNKIQLAVLYPWKLLDFKMFEFADKGELRGRCYGHLRSAHKLCCALLWLKISIDLVRCL
ncbi:Transcription factor-related, putative isoform 2 [Hibiscus syriacus]|uniref:Transcription factor-related, putative isoform 2 n=1 Tax=Hibiscus syriacus TaxID=106335 RepID=A0A6A2YI72_HIBSY|nr:Transcription factor-related, putative isoform 2 [Hibiscus syriacus]